jgi:hypothetical protein
MTIMGMLMIYLHIQFHISCISTVIESEYRFQMVTILTYFMSYKEFFFQLASTVLIGPWPSLMDFSIHRHLVGLLG